MLNSKFNRVLFEVKVINGLYQNCVGRIIDTQSPRINGENDVVLLLSDEDVRKTGVRVIGINEKDCRYA